MFIDVSNVYKSKTVNLSGSGTMQFDKDVNLLSLKVSNFIFGNIEKNKTIKKTVFNKIIYAVRVKGNVRVGKGFIMNRIEVNKGGEPF